jgi:plasmid stabilization system protein ParE
MKTFEVEISEPAEVDVRDAYLWYQNQKEGLGQVFQEYFSEAIASIRNNPEEFQIRYLEVRIHFLKKFPYGIHYIIQGQKVIIIAVFHTSRSPKKWKKRITEI